MSKKIKPFIISMLPVISAVACFAAATPVRMELKVDGVTREAAVYYPAAASGEKRPLVFVFHGHGGTIKSASSSFAYQLQWPEAIVVYMQGLATPIALTDPEGKLPGWQVASGDSGDRDIAFFDAVLAHMMKTGRVDEKRIYVSGHSNGGIFAFLLWAVRGDVFAAVATSSSFAATAETELRLTPKPLFHIAGTRDPIVKYPWQEETISHVLSMNGCSAPEQKWRGSAYCTLYPSATRTPVVTYIHSGGHEFQSDAVPLVVSFLKAQAKD